MRSLDLFWFALLCALFIGTIYFARRTIRRLQHTLRDQALLLATVGHEIRTPLHGASGYLELLENTALSNNQRESIAMIRHSFSHLQTLLDDLLDAAKIDANALTLDLRPIHINAVIEHCVQHFAPAILAQGLALHCYTDPALDGQVLESDKRRLSQIIQNLIGNAAKFTRHGSITVSSQWLKQDKKQAWVCIEVTDTGIGIAPEFQARLFQPFVQTGAANSSHFGGSGLGLFICRNLTERMGGHLTLQSTPGAGSLFRIELLFPIPAVRPAAHPPLSALSIRIETEDLRLRQILTTRVEQWGATVYQPSHQSRSAPVDIQLTTQPHTPDDLAQAQEAPRLGTLHLTARGPLTPLRDGRVVNVSLFSSHALLAAMLDFTHSNTVSGSDVDAYLPSYSHALSPTLPSAAPNQELDILIVEDDPVSQTLIERQLQALGYTRLRFATNGREALNMWLARRADVVLTDLNIPCLDGLNLLKEIRAHASDAYVIATTATDAASITRQTAAQVRSSFSYILYKPVLLAELRRALSAISVSTRNASHTQTQPHAETDIPHSENTLPASRIEHVLYEAFLQYWPNERASIVAILASRNVERSYRSLHRLQGALLAMGQEGLAADCIALQALCAANDWNQVDTSLKKLIAALDQLTSPNK